MDTEVTTNPRMFPALRILERQAPPLHNGFEPFWRAPVTPPSRSVLIPSWNWRSIHTDWPEGDEPVTLDANGAFLAALGSIDVAHGHLKHYEGPLDPYKFRRPFDSQVRPGYYLVDVPNWAFGGTLVSPLGDSARLETSVQVWVAHPTLILLLELLEEGSIGQLIISEAWVSERRCNFREWSKRMKAVRNGLLDNIDGVHPEGVPQGCKCPTCQRYRAFKEGYGAAFSMMLTGERCQTRRPDWAHAVYAQHAATSWRKAWRFSTLGTVLAMGTVDELTVLRADLDRAVAAPKPPVRLDHTGRTLGHLKEKKNEPEPAPEGDEPTGAADIILSDDFGDLL